MKVIPVLTTYMETRDPPEGPYPDPPVEGISIERVRDITTKAYRELYTAVGGPYRWYDRLIMEDSELRKILQSEDTEIYLVKIKGRTSGYFEIDRKNPSDVEIAYLGLIREFHGKGLGRYLLTLCLEKAWCERTERVWLHTCEWDHPGAIPLYESAGFTIYKTEFHDQRIPLIHR